jgi:hypothetical protein
MDLSSKGTLTKMDDSNGLGGTNFRVENPESAGENNESHLSPKGKNV